MTNNIKSTTKSNPTPIKKTVNAAGAVNVKTSQNKKKATVDITKSANNQKTKMSSVKADVIKKSNFKKATNNSNIAKKKECGLKMKEQPNNIHKSSKSVEKNADKIKIAREKKIMLNRKAIKKNWASEASKVARETYGMWQSISTTGSTNLYEAKKQCFDMAKQAYVMNGKMDGIGRTVGNMMANSTLAQGTVNSQELALKKAGFYKNK